MARTNVIRLNEGAGIKEASRRTRWGIPPNSPLKPEDLNFTGRDEEGRFVWWVVSVPKTDYCHPHHALGKAYAFELLDLMNNPAAEYPPGILAFVTSAMMRWANQTNAAASEAVIYGFFSVLSEFIGTGTAVR